MRIILGLIFVMSACATNNVTSRNNPCAAKLAGTWSVVDTREAAASQSPECSALQSLPPSISTPGTTVDNGATVWTEPSADGNQSYVYQIELDENCTATITREQREGSDSVVVQRSMVVEDDGSLSGLTLITLSSSDKCKVIYETTATRE